MIVVPTEQKPELIEPYIASKGELYDDLKDVLVSEFGIHQEGVEELINNNLRCHLDRLKDELYTVIESPYVDKVYRDSYYSYYSSKYGTCQRDGIRLCFFLSEVDRSMFYDEARYDYLNDNFVGFMVLRPTVPHIVGRSVISSKALKENGFFHCSAKFEVTVCGVKLNVEGFPHSSQDSETITCAETTVWSTMEYFGTKYPEYTPVLPSKIIDVLKNLSIERQIPSQGLTVDQISFAIKKFGFGAKLYSKAVYGEDFKRLFNTYVESGVPVIVAVDNYNYDGEIGHAVLCIGHSDVAEKEVGELKEKEIINSSIGDQLRKRSIKCFDYGDIDMEYVFIDDNFPAYQRALLDKPVEHYRDKEWEKCEVTNFIVPLYPKIYLEAFEARNLIYQLIAYEKFELVPDDSDVYVKIFLTSSRSYKNEMSINRLDEEAKDAILQTPMPKFIWVAELGTKESVEKNCANGIIILDATEANLNDFRPLILCLSNNNFIPSGNKFGFFKKYELPLSQFKNYKNNLKRTLNA